MSILENHRYCNMPFTSEICQDEFYSYSNVASLMSKCEKFKEKTIKIRTIGVLESINGRFFIKGLDSANNDASKLLVSMAYVKSSLHSSIIPYTVQVFGSIQWTSQPIIYAQIVQVLNTAVALRLNDAMQSIYDKHLANASK